MAYISPILSGITDAVKKTSVALTRDFNELEHLQNSVHGDNGFAMRSLQKATSVLQAQLAKIKPSHTFITADNNVALPSNGNYFLAMPIDGYANFAHGNAEFAISVALFEANVLTDAVVYSPIFDELFFAEKGNGAFKEGFRNFERIRVASQRNEDRALFSVKADATAICNVLNISSNLLVSGAISRDMAYVAAGKTDVAIGQNYHPAQVAAGILLVKEAGGYVFALGQKDIRSEDLNKVIFGQGAVATNEALKQKIADKLV